MPTWTYQSPVVISLTPRPHSKLDEGLAKEATKALGKGDRKLDTNIQSQLVSTKTFLNLRVAPTKGSNHKTQAKWTDNQ